MKAKNHQVPPLRIGALSPARRILNAVKLLSVLAAEAHHAAAVAKPT